MQLSRCPDLPPPQCGPWSPAQRLKAEFAAFLLKGACCPLSPAKPIVREEFPCPLGPAPSSLAPPRQACTPGMLGIGQFCKSTVLTLGKVFVYRAGEGLGRDQRCWAAWVGTKDAPDQKGPGFYSADHVLSKSCLLGSEAAPDGRPLSSRSRPGTGVTAPLLVARVSEPPGCLSTCCPLGP